MPEKSNHKAAVTERQKMTEIFD